MGQLEGFLTKEKSEQFLVPLLDISKVVTESVLLRINHKDKNILIRSSNKPGTVYSIIYYNKDFLSDFTIEKDYIFSIHNLNEFYGMTKLFTNGFKCKSENFHDENPVDLILSDNNQTYTYIAGDSCLIKEGPKGLKIAEIPWLTEFNWTADKFSPFKTALGNLKHEHVLFEGNEGETDIKIKITQKGMRSSSYTIKIPANKVITKNFSILFDKDKFLPLSTLSIKNFTVYIMEELLAFTGTSPYHKMMLMLAPREG